MPLRFLLACLCISALHAAQRPPNIILFLTDDQGYADVGCFGARNLRTPNLDRMAAEGMKLTSFYVAQPVCTASRAAIMTGCYSNRVGLFGALNHTSTIGISGNETLIPQLCKQRGYATA
jgi:arylsulfatase A-like enzyme